MLFILQNAEPQSPPNNSRGNIKCSTKIYGICFLINTIKFQKYVPGEIVTREPSHVALNSVFSNHQKYLFES